MNQPSEKQATRFANFNRGQARAVIALFVALAATFVIVSVSPWRVDLSAREDRPSDLELYWAEVERIQAGEGYYEAAAAELAEFGFPTHSVFNWRVPLPMWMLAKLPAPEWGHWMLRVLAIALLAIGVIVMRRESSFVEAAVLGICLTGAVMPCLVGNLYVEPLLWSGVLIGLSMMAFYWLRDWAAIGLGTAALFFRDFAGLYCVVMTCSALQRRQWKLAAGWIAGILAFAAFFLIHAVQVARFAGSDGIADTQPWLTFLGLPGIISMTQMNGFLLLLPQWVTAIYLSLGLLGFAAWNSRLGIHMGLTIAAYLVVFSIIGMEVNKYWGTVYTPLLCFGAARSVGALRDLFLAAR